MRSTCDAAIANITELAAFVSKLSEAQVGKFLSKSKQEEEQR